MTNLLIVVPTYRNPEQLSGCLRTLLKYAPYSYQIIVSDQAEDTEDQAEVDRVIEALKSNKVSSVHFGNNSVGAWERHVNNILLESSLQYGCWLHDDTISPPNSQDFWYRLVGVAEDEKVGIVGPSTNNGEGYQDVLRTDVPDRIKTHSVHVPCVLFRTEVFKKLGGIDTSLHLGSGIVDLCIRVHLEGYDLVIDRKAYVHHVGASTYKRSKTDRELNEWLRGLMDVTHNDMIRKHGVKIYAEYIGRTHEKDAIEILCGDFDWSVRLNRAMIFKVEEWMPTT